ncbi:hypothetical protein J3459_007921 [Metarhizium acridum]|uniref:uncharacterized protein n=1 Tax=Metarhizium acridum TaxID=92637 RepID=UPI001C6B5253|nr:hypothetical protein J3458_018935 [Metarhizium acridum]KAG8426649.1 hypothetical protein J3459_007921 [Metarhizium acridum]
MGHALMLRETPGAHDSWGQSNARKKRYKECHAPWDRLAGHATRRNLALPNRLSQIHITQREAACPRTIDIGKKSTTEYNPPLIERCCQIRLDLLFLKCNTLQVFASRIYLRLEKPTTTSPTDEHLDGQKSGGDDLVIMQ